MERGDWVSLATSKRFGTTPSKWFLRWGLVPAPIPEGLPVGVSVKPMQVGALEIGLAGSGIRPKGLLL